MKIKRKMLKIDEELCDGCGECVVDCAEGAIEIVDGKAKIIKESYCDGLGACIGSCPTGALSIEEREAEEFEGPNPNMPTPHEATQDGGHTHPDGSACPGSKILNLKQDSPQATSETSFVQAIPSELAQWPIQLHLVNPSAPYFKNKELVLLSTCAPVASADVHWRYLRGRSVVLACPKLDVTDPYIAKLSEILKESSIPKLIIPRMEVPCCGGLAMIAKEAQAASGREDLKVEEHIITLDGKLKDVKDI